MDTEKDFPEETTPTPSEPQETENDVEEISEENPEDVETKENQDQEVATNTEENNGNNSYQKTDDTLLDNLIYDTNQVLKTADKAQQFFNKNKAKSQTQNGETKEDKETEADAETANNENDTTTNENDAEISPSSEDTEMPSESMDNDEENTETDSGTTSSDQPSNDEDINVENADNPADSEGNDKPSESDTEGKNTDSDLDNSDQERVTPQNDLDDDNNNFDNDDEDEESYFPDQEKKNKGADSTNNSYDLPWRKKGRNPNQRRNQTASVQPSNPREHLATTANNSQVKMGEKAANNAKNIRNNLNRQAVQEAADAKMAGGAGKLLKALKNIKMMGANKMIKVALIVCALALATITVIFTYALPSSQYEYAETYTKEYYQEMYETELYEGADRISFWKKISTAFKVTAEAISDKIGEKMSQLKAFANIVKLANVDEDGNAIEEFSDDARELKAAYVTDIQKRTLKDKIQATQTKVDGRIDNLEKALDKQRGKIENAIEDKYKTSEFDEFIPIVTFNTSYLSEEGGAAIMALYMAQEGGKLEDVRISSLLKWLGYNEERGKVAFTAVNTKCEAEQWEGSFLPQYLHEQELQDENVEKHYRVKKLSGQKYEDNRTAAVDLIVMVDAPELDDLTVDKTVIKNKDGSEKVIGRVNCEINIRPREFKDIADLMGMWIGDLSKRQDYMPSYLNVNMIASGGGFGLIDGNYEWIEGGDLMPWKPYHNLYQSWVGIHGQCTWYAADRLYQLFVETNGEMGIDLKGQPMGNGGQWSQTARNMGFHVDHVAAVGKAACFVPGQTKSHPGDDWSVDAFSGSAGHIAIVEKVNPDGSIVVSEFWGSQVDYKVHFSKFTAATAATIDFIDFTRRS